MNSRTSMAQPLIGFTVAALLLFAAALCVLVSCAPQQSSDKGAPDASASTSSAEVAWTPEAECASCHAAEQASYDNASCEAYEHKDSDCKQCHADEAALATVHEGKTTADTLPTRLKKTAVEDALCLSCHFGDRESLTAATNETAVLTDIQGTSCNPHDVRGVKEHESLSCGACHDMHSDKDIQERAMKQCESCHHAGVFECYTCHE